MNESCALASYRYHTNLDLFAGRKRTSGYCGVVVMVALEALQQEEVAGCSGVAGLGQVILLHSSGQNSRILL